MTPGAPLEALEARLRETLGAEDLAASRKLIGAYRRRLDAELSAMAPGDAEAARKLARARELFDWARKMALGVRSRAAAGLERLPRRTAYSRRPSGADRSWELEG